AELGFSGRVTTEYGHGIFGVDADEGLTRARGILCEASFHLNIRRLDDCGPLRALRREHLVEILRGADLDLGAERFEPRAGLRRGERLAECAVELADDGGWRSSGRYYREPKRRLQLRKASLDYGRHVWQFRMAHVAGDRNRAQLAGLDVGQAGGAGIGDDLHLIGQNGIEHGP